MTTAEKIITPAASIAELEILLNDAEASGLAYVHAGWIAPREMSVTVKEANAVGWITYLAKLGYRMDHASASGQARDVTAHARHPDGRRLSLTMQTQAQEQAA